MSITGFIYEIIVMIGNEPPYEVVVSIVYYGAQIYVIASLLGTFILSIYG